MSLEVSATLLLSVSLGWLFVEIVFNKIRCLRLSTTRERQRKDSLGFAKVIKKLRNISGIEQKLEIVRFISALFRLLVAAFVFSIVTQRQYEKFIS